MAYTTIDDPSAYFHTQLYTGNNNTSQTITNDGNSDLQPDWLWIKNRDDVEKHHLMDSSRGANKFLHSNETAVERTGSHGNGHNAINTINSDGFTITSNGSNDELNFGTRLYVAWQWKANGGTTASNSDGSITSTVQANTTAGFSIVTYTGNGSNATVGHGLGSAPNWVLVKSRGNADPWHNLVDDIGADETLEFNTFNMGTGIWNNTRPTSSVFSIGTNNGVNRSSGTFVAYCFAEKQGYSKFGSYTGNGSTNGTFVYTGFKPAWTMIKNIQTNGYNWVIQDTKRFGGINSGATDKNLAANSNSAEPSSGSFAGNEIDFLSNGFKLRSTAGNTNAAQSYIYMAFAESPFVSSEGVPTTAR